MGSFSIWHWMLFGAVALLLFGGKGKISDIMGDVAKGIKSFKKGMADDSEEEKPVAPALRSLDTPPGRRGKQGPREGRLSPTFWEVRPPRGCKPAGSQFLRAVLRPNDR